MALGALTNFEFGVPRNPATAETAEEAAKRLRIQQEFARAFSGLSGRAINEALGAGFGGFPGIGSAVVRQSLFGQIDPGIGLEQFSQEIQAGDTETARRRARANRSVLTSSRGILTEPRTTGKALLGQ